MTQQQCAMSTFGTFGRQTHFLMTSAGVPATDAPADLSASHCKPVSACPESLLYAVMHGRLLTQTNDNAMPCMAMCLLR